MRSVKDCRILNVPRITDPRGDLSFVESMRSVPFKVHSVYWRHHVPAGFSTDRETRDCHEFIIPLSGSFNVIVSDDTAEREFVLDTPYVGLYVPDMLWRTIVGFSTNAVCCVLTSGGFGDNAGPADAAEPRS